MFGQTLIRVITAKKKYELIPVIRGITIGTLIIEGK
jgi:hypothetical protein